MQKNVAYLLDNAALTISVGIEDVPKNLGFFDTAFSMGALYHRPAPLEHLQQLK